MTAETIEFVGVIILGMTFCFSFGWSLASYLARKDRP